MKKYGVYLAFDLRTDLRCQGLGRHLAHFLKSTLDRKDIAFVIACPFVIKKNILALFEDFQIQSDAFEIISVSPFVSLSLVLSLDEKLRKWKQHFQMYSLKPIFLKNFKKPFSRFFIFCLFIIFLPIILTGFFFAVALYLLKFFLKKLKSFLLRNVIIASVARRIVKPMLNYLKPSLYYNLLINKIIKKLSDDNNLGLIEKINKRTDIIAWYAPVPFWPAFPQIQRPTLVGVPDVVYTHFPVSFSMAFRGGQAPILQSASNIEQVLLKSKYIVTYSQDVKYNTLVKAFQHDPEDIFVIPHAPSQLDHLIVAKAALKKDQAKQLSEDIFSYTVVHAYGHHYAYIYAQSRIKFIFYASQARPHKNILSLLKAYRFLLRKRYITHKLILTGNPYSLCAVNTYISDHRLENDVLWLHGMTSQQLAACYYLADLTVNPSLSEGGCPFTLTEALSVDTPVVMARINVTEEIVTDPELKEKMLFDPYNWEEMAEKIEWGLKNKEELLAAQKPLYNELIKRTWSDVLGEYVKVLDHIVEQERAQPC